MGALRTASETAPFLFSAREETGLPGSLRTILQPTRLGRISDQSPVDVNHFTPELQGGVYGLGEEGLGHFKELKLADRVSVGRFL